MVEAAVVFSVLITLIFGIMEFGTAFWQWNTMTLAVQQAGRYMMINNSCGANCASTAESQMRTVLTSASVCSGASNPPTAGNICVYAGTPTGTNPTTISLTAIYAYQVLGISGTISVASQGTFPLD